MATYGALMVTFQSTPPSLAEMHVSVNCMELWLISIHSAIASGDSKGGVSESVFD